MRKLLDSPWANPYAGRTTDFAPVKSLRFFELFLELSLFEFHFTVLFPLGCGVDSPEKQLKKQLWHRKALEILQ